MSDAILKISMSELCQANNISRELLIEVVDYGIAEPIAGNNQDEWVFDTSDIHWLKKAIRLNRDMEIEWVAVAMVIDLLKQKESLQRENENLNQLIRRLT
jgi:chaperone modulatory protein CbpM